jgi:hypothetical protein
MTTATTTLTTTAASKTDNPHRIAAGILGWAIPFVLIGAIWGATNDPAHAGISAAAFLAILVLYGIKKAQYGAWNLRHRGAK